MTPSKVLNNFLPLKSFSILVTRLYTLLRALSDLEATSKKEAQSFSCEGYLINVLINHFIKYFTSTCFTTSIRKANRGWAWRAWFWGQVFEFSLCVTITCSTCFSTLDFKVACLVWKLNICIIYMSYNLHKF